jgi:hypothetical protein
MHVEVGIVDAAREVLGIFEDDRLLVLSAPDWPRAV